MKQSIKATLLLTFFMRTNGLHAIDVTVYNNNLGLVREERIFQLKKGLNNLDITDVPSMIDATSVHFKSLTDPDRTQVLEQNFQYDLISQEKILEKYIGKEIQLETYRGLSGEKRELIKGTLLSIDGGRVLKVGNQIYLNPAGNPILPELPEGLKTQPTLQWNLLSQQSGKQTCEITYMTAGMGWNADYIVMTNANDDKMDLNSWVTINNNSGAIFKDAKLKLVAGDVNRVQDKFKQDRRLGMAKMASAVYESDAAGFAEKSFFEYHLYTLGRPTSLMNNETKQIEMANAVNVPLKKKYIYDAVKNIYSADYNEYTRSDANYGLESDKKVDVTLEFKNSKDNNLGMPLPKGRVRVYKKDTDGSSQFIGEDAIDHTPKDETLRIKMGQAFDIVGERKRIDFSIDHNKKQFIETFELKLRNHKEEAVSVHVVEHLYRWTNWKITQSSIPHKKKDAQTIEFETPIAKNGETILTYTVKYTW